VVHMQSAKETADTPLGRSSIATAALPDSIEEVPFPAGAQHDWSGTSVRWVERKDPDTARFFVACTHPAGTTLRAEGAWTRSTDGNWPEQFSSVLQSILATPPPAR